MSRKLTLLIFFLLINQFCAQAQNWLTVGNGLTVGVNSMVADTANHKIYASGYWGSSHRFLQYNDSTGIWSPLGTNTVAGNCFGIIIYRGEIYGSAPSGVYKLIGANWQCVAPSHGVVFNLCVHDTDLYAVGSFDSIAGIQAFKIARFDGYTWHNVGNINVNNSIQCAIFYQGELYVAGSFYNSATGRYKILKWDGNQWDILAGTGNYFSGGWDYIDCMTIYNNELYVGGYFTYSQGGNPGNNIAKWNGSTWNAVGGGTDFQVFSMQIFNGDLWVGGQFTSAGGLSTSYVSKWNGTDWCNIGNFDNSIGCFCIYNSELYAGGGQLTVDGDTVNKVVKWIGGSNTGACGHLSTGIEEAANNFSVNIFPNPVITNATFQFTALGENKTLIIFDQLGKEIWRKETDENQIEFSTEGIPAGLYFYRVEQEKELNVNGRFIIQ